MKKQLKQLEEFHKAFGLYMNECPTLRIPQELHELRMRVMKEEVDEYAHESNMSKLDENGKPIYREDGKILKSSRYHEPDLSFLKNKK